MKFFARLSLLLVFALALSFTVVSADEDESASLGFFVQAGSAFTFDTNDPAIGQLTVTGVAGVTPVFFFEGATGGYPTVDFIDDWMGSGYTASATLRFQLGGSTADAEGLYVTTDFTLKVALIPTAKFEDGTVVYDVMLEEVLGEDIFGTSPTDVEVEANERPVDTLNEYLSGGILNGTELTIFVQLDDVFFAALRDARFARLTGTRPTGTGGTCLPGFTCK